LKHSAAAAALLFLLAVTLAAEDARIEKRTFVSAGRERIFSLYVPEGAGDPDPAPLPVLLHGSGRNAK
jgi:poly(3-hydroxybutyrate) depolymerase